MLKNKKRENAQGLIVALAFMFALIAIIIALSNVVNIKVIDQRLIDREYFYGLIDDWHTIPDTTPVSSIFYELIVDPNDTLPAVETPFPLIDFENGMMSMRDSSIRLEPQNVPDWMREFDSLAYIFDSLGAIRDSIRSANPSPVGW